MNQDTYAANDGDILKHALLHEALVRCSRWQSPAYSETHAGAGVYLARHQAENRKHIKPLRKLVEAEPAGTRGAGSGYRRLLADWWLKESRAGAYPGSVLQAATFLAGAGKLTEGSVRATENDPETFERLAAAFESVRPAQHLRGGDYRDHLEWLAGRDRLLLLVDPYKYLGLERIEELLDAVGGPDAVVLLWHSFAHAVGMTNQAELMTGLLASTTRRGGACRWFRRRQYHVAAVGFGKGREVVADLPATAAWEAGWPGGFVKELDLRSGEVLA